MPRITREQAVELVKKQMVGETPGSQTPMTCWHYGWCEMQELLDQIYGHNSKGEPVVSIKMEDVK